MGRTTPSPKRMMITAVATILTILASTCMARDVLLSGEVLEAGQSLDVGNYHLRMQEDCNLVLYDYVTAIWASNTDLPGQITRCRAVLLSNGNFGVYNAAGVARWTSKSDRGNGNYVLVLRYDGNVVIYGSDIWSTGTGRKKVGGAVVVAMNGTTDGASVIGPVVVNQNARDILLSGEVLEAGQSLDVENYHFRMQEDCNLVLYHYVTAIWASGTDLPGQITKCRAVLLSNGNFGVYSADGVARWTSKSNRGNGNYVLVLRYDGNVVIYGSDIWSTGTGREKVGGSVIEPVDVTAAGEVATAA